MDITSILEKVKVGEPLSVSKVKKHAKIIGYGLMSICNVNIEI